MRLRLRPPRPLRPGDRPPAALRRALLLGRAWLLPPHDDSEQRLLLADTPGGPSLWSERPRHGARRWSAVLVGGGERPAPPFPRDPRRIPPSLVFALAQTLPLLPGRAAAQRRLADLLRVAHGAIRLRWDAPLVVRAGRSGFRLRQAPWLGALRLEDGGDASSNWREDDHLRASVPSGLVPHLFPAYALPGDLPVPKIDAEGFRPTAHERLAARHRLETLHGPFG